MLACYIELNRVTAANDLIKECEDGAPGHDKVLSGQSLYQVAIPTKQTARFSHALSGNAIHDGNIHSVWLSNMIRLELAARLVKSINLILQTGYWNRLVRELSSMASPILNLQLCNALGEVCAQRDDFKSALEYQKAYRIESDLMKKIPIGELGASQLRRLSRFELQLKLIF